MHEIAAFVARDRDKYERELMPSRKRLEELVAEANRLHAEAKDRALFAEQMMGIVSHDLRNPLSTIAHGGGAAGAGDLIASQQRVAGAYHPRDRTRQPPDRGPARLHAGAAGQGLAVALEPIDLHASFAEAVDDLRARLPGPDAGARARRRRPCLADANRLAQLVGNLVSNAMTYGTPEAPVTVDLDDRRELVRDLRAQRRRRPIPPEVLPHIFQPMSRGTDAGRASRSVGLGLYIVSEIARRTAGAPPSPRWRARGRPSPPSSRGPPPGHELEIAASMAIDAINDAADDTVIGRTLRKPSYPISRRLAAYLARFRRELELPVSYERLEGFRESLPLRSAEGQDTLVGDGAVSARRDGRRLKVDLKHIYALLRVDGDFSVIQHLYVDRVDFCTFGNSTPFRIRIVNAFNDNPDYFYIKQADASRVYGLELEHLLSPNRLNFLTHANTLVEEHIPGVPGDIFIPGWLDNGELRPVRIAKELVKINERCFVRLLGDMRTYNFVFVLTPDFEDAQLRIRAMDFDQQSPPRAEEPSISRSSSRKTASSRSFATKTSTARLHYQYQREEQTLILARADSPPSSGWSILLDAMHVGRHRAARERDPAAPGAGRALRRRRVPASASPWPRSSARTCARSGWKRRTGGPAWPAAQALRRADFAAGAAGSALAGAALAALARAALFSGELYSLRRS